MENNIREYQSFSSLATFMRCGMQYKFRYVDGIKTPPAVAMIEGSAGHKGQEVNYSQKIERRKDLPVNDVLDAVSDEFEVRQPEVEDWEDQQPGKVKDGIVNLMKYVHKMHFPKVQPVKVEEQYVVDVNGHKLKAYLDLLDETPAVRDAKFTKRAKSQSDANNDLQLTIYSYCAKTENVVFDCMIKGPKPRVAVVAGTRDKRDWQRLELLVPSLIQTINAGLFMPADPAHWCCTEKFCGYWFRCPHGGGKPEPIVVDMGQNINERDLL